MHVKAFRLVCLVACLAMAVTVLAQAGHPLKGSWSGDWGPTADHRNHVLLLLEWDGRQITGTINPGPNAIPLTQAELDPSDWTVRMEAMVPYRGQPTLYVMEGQIENLGSWTARTITGTYRHGDQSGDFKVEIN